MQAEPELAALLPHFPRVVGVQPCVATPGCNLEMSKRCLVSLSEGPWNNIYNILSKIILNITLPLP